MRNQIVEYFDDLLAAREPYVRLRNADRKILAATPGDPVATARLTKTLSDMSALDTYAQDADRKVVPSVPAYGTITLGSVAADQTYYGVSIEQVLTASFPVLTFTEYSGDLSWTPETAWSSATVSGRVGFVIIATSERVSQAATLASLAAVKRALNFASGGVTIDLPLAFLVSDDTTDFAAATAAGYGTITAS
jgi:hypothetical protein